MPLEELGPQEAVAKRLIAAEAAAVELVTLADQLARQVPARAVLPARTAGWQQKQKG